MNFTPNGKECLCTEDISENQLRKFKVIIDDP